MNISIYARKSKSTEKGESISNQIETAKSYINLNYPGEEHTFFVYQDDGFSGKNTNRPGFVRMMRELKDKSIDCVAVYRFDRISRNVVDFVSVTKRLEVAGVKFVSVNEKFDTNTAMGKAMMMISAVFAELERETIAERVRDNMVMLSQTGRWLGGRCPYGYSSERIEGNKALGTKSKSRLVINEDEMQIVKLIYKLYEEKGSLHAVGVYLFEHDIVIRGKTKQTDTFIKKMLQNPTYCIADKDALEYFSDLGSSLPLDAEERFDGEHGIMPFCRHETKNNTMVNRDESDWIIAVGEHEGVISGSRWVKIQMRMAENAARYDSYSSATNDYALLSGLLFCGKCGKRMYTKKQSKKGRTGSVNSFFYVCDTKRNYTSKACPMRDILGSKLDGAFIKMLAQYDAPESEIREALVKKWKSKKASKAAVSEISIYKKQIEEIEKKRMGMFGYMGELMSDGKGIPPEVKAAVDKMTEDIAELRKKIEEAEEEKKEAKESEKVIAMFEEFIRDGEKAMRAMPVPMLRDEIKRFVDHAEWDGEQLRVFLRGT